MKALFLTIFTLLSYVAFAQSGHRYGGSSDDYAKDIQMDSSGAIYICGYSYSNDNDLDTNYGFDDAWLAKMDSNGNVIWSNNYGGAKSDRFNKILLHNGLIYCVGQTSSDSGDVSKHYGNSDFWLVVVDDSTGSIQYDSCYGGLQNQMATSIISLSNGHFIIGGSSDDSSGQISNHIGSYDFWIIEIDSLGNLLQEKSFGGPDYDFLYSMALLPNNELLIGGTTQNPGVAFSNYHGSVDGALACIDTNWNSRWKICYGESNSDYIYDIKVRSLDTIILTGNSTSQSPNSFSQSDATVWQIDRIGSISNITYFGGSKVDIFSNCAIESDSTYVFIGKSNSINEHISSNKGAYDVFVARTNLDYKIISIDNFGGDNDDIGVGIVSNGNSKLWFLANSKSIVGDIPPPLGQQDAWIFSDTIAKYTVDIHEISIKDGNIKIYPNPTIGFLYIQSDAFIYQIDIYNIVGSCVLKYDCKSKSEHINVKNLSKGVYFIVINKGEHVYRFLRQ